MIRACSANKDKTPMAATIGASNMNALTNEQKVNTMNTLAVTNQNVTMSSREIANLTGKKHADICRDIRVMLAEMYNGTEKDYIRNADLLYLTNQCVSCVHYDSKNPNAWEYLLDRYHSEVLVTGYDVKRRAAVIKRWYDLETGQAKPVVDPMTALNDPSFLRSTLLTYTEKVIELESQVEEMKPDVEDLTRIAKSQGSMCVTDAAKQLQVKPKSLFGIMSQCKWIYRRLGTPWIGYQDKIQQGLIEHKVTVITKPDGEDKSIPQVRVTPKGLSKLAKLLTQGAEA